MADNVTGSLGGQNVFLENAATEATLQLLLKATLATTAEQKKAISDLVQKAGIDPATVQRANEEVENLGKVAAQTGSRIDVLNTQADQMRKIFGAASDVVGQLTSGAGQASGVFGSIAGMGGVIGIVAAGFQKLAQFQEEQLKNYQSLTQNGINFGGSLTSARLAASGMYLTMDEFSKLMKDNSQTFASMGESATKGAQSFVAMSQQLIQGPMGENLQALGYTAAEVSSGFATFLAATSSNNSKAINDQKKLSEGAGAYLMQLDELAQITGKSKEEQINAAKERAANVALEAHMMTLSADERIKAEAALADARAKGGKGAEEALMSALMGFPPMTKAAQEYTAVAGNMSKVTQQQAAAVKDSSKTLEDTRKISTGYNAAAIKDKEALGVSGRAIVMQGGALATTVGSVIGTANRVQKSGVETAEQAAAQQKKIMDEQLAAKDKEAGRAVGTTRALQDLGNTILKILMPAIQMLLPVLNAIAPLAPAIFGVIAALAAFKTAMATKSMLSSLGGGGKSLPAVGGAKGAGGSLPGIAGGEGAGKSLKGLAGGLKAFSNPKILLGATILGATITIIGAGIAGATWILGKALPTFAEGLKAFDELDGKNLGDVGLGVIQLGAGLVAFGAGGAIAGIGGIVGSLAEGFGSLFGVKSPLDKMMEFAKVGPELKLAGDGIASFNTNLAKLLNTDTANIKNLSGNLTNLAVSLKQLREASKPVEKSFLSASADALKSALTPETTKAPAAGTAGAQVANKPDADKKESSNPTLKSDVQESLRIEVAKLNSTSMELLRAMRESAENTKRTASILASRGNLLKG